MCRNLEKIKYLNIYQYRIICIMLSVLQPCCQEQYSSNSTNVRVATYVTHTDVDVKMTLTHHDNTYISCIARTPKRFLATAWLLLCLCCVFYSVWWPSLMGWHKLYSRKYFTQFVRYIITYACTCCYTPP